MNLKGLRILNTRPLDQGQALTRAIHAEGGIAVVLPALSIEPTSDAWVKQLPTLTGIQQAIFISPNAVNYFYQALAKYHITWPECIETLAIGKATAKALSQWNIRTDKIPPIADSEHLLQVASLQNIRAKSILLIKGEGGREEIANELLSRKAHLIPVVVYRRALPKTSSQQVQRLWQDNAVDIILFTSQQAIHNIFALFGKDAHPWLCSKPCIVISERLADIARAVGMQQIIVSQYDSITATLAEYYNKD